MAGGGPGGSGGSSGAPSGFFARLKTDLAGVSNTLTLLPYQGNTVLVNGQTVTIPGGGLARPVSDNYIDAAGADSGGNPVANTLFYVYISNALASFSPSSIRLSLVAPTLVNGVKYLGAAADALNWRFVGWTYISPTTQFESSETSRFIINYYNRFSLTLLCAPGWTNSNAQQTSPMPGGAWGLINGGVGDGFKWVGNGEDSVLLHLGAATDGGLAVVTYAGISVNGGDPKNASIQAVLAVTIFSTQEMDPVEGLNTADIWGYGPGGGLFFHDFPRNGLAVGPKVTYMDTIVQG